MAALALAARKGPCDLLRHVATHRSSKTHRFIAAAVRSPANDPPDRWSVTLTNLKMIQRSSTAARGRSSASRSTAFAEADTDDEDDFMDVECDVEDDDEEEDEDGVSYLEDEERLWLWRRLCADVPLASVLPRDLSFGVGVEGRDGEAAERMAFYGDKMLNLSVARALYAEQMEAGGDATTLSVGEMSTIVAAARSNTHFARLLRRVLTPEMVAAVPEDAIAQGRQHSVGTMVEAAVFTVHEGSNDGPEAIAQLGAFLLAEARLQAASITNYKGTLCELMQKGVPGMLRTRAVDKYFEATAKLDGAAVRARGRNKREAEQRAAKAVFTRLLTRDAGLGDNAWVGTPESPKPPARAISNEAECTTSTLSEENSALIDPVSEEPSPASPSPIQSNYKGSLYEFVAKGVEGALTVKGFNMNTADLYFEATAWLDWETAKMRGRSKREAEQRASKAVFEKLIERGAAEGNDDKGRWTGTPETPTAPPSAFTGNP